MIKREIGILLISIVLFSGCVGSSPVVEKSRINIDNQELNIKNTYEDSVHGTKKAYNYIASGIGSGFGSLLNSSLMKTFLSDEQIISNQQDYVIYTKGRRYNGKKIIKNYLRTTKGISDINSLDLSQKIKIINNYFLIKQQNKYEKDFLKKNPKPLLDEFKTDLDNTKALNSYKYQLNLSQNRYESLIPEIKKDIAVKTLLALYGNPTCSSFKYDPYSEKVIVIISSDRENFKQNVELDIEVELAKKMQGRYKKIIPKLYYKLSDDTLELVGASLIYEKKDYVVKFTDEDYVRKSSLTMHSKDMNLDKLDLNYKEIHKNIEYPEWYNTLETAENEIVGYGSGESEEEAKNIAYANIASELGVKVNSSSSIIKKSSGNNFSSKSSQNIKVDSGSRKLKGAKVIKTEKNNGIYFSAVSYIKK